MFLPSLLSLAIALVAIWLGTWILDDIVRLTVALMALFCLFLSLVFAPLPANLLLIIALSVSQKHINTLIWRYLKVGEGREMACPLGRLGKGEMCTISCLYALRKNQQQRFSSHTITPSRNCCIYPLLKVSL